MYKEPVSVSVGVQTDPAITPRFDGSLALLRGGSGENALASLLSGNPESLLDVAPFWGSSKSAKKRAEYAYERKAFRSSFAPFRYDTASVDIDVVAKKKLSEALAVVME